MWGVEWAAWGYEVLTPLDSRWWPIKFGGGASIRGFERVDQKLVQENRPVVEVAIMGRFSIRGFE